jgi:hypothetical protein
LFVEAMALGFNIRAQHWLKGDILDRGRRSNVQVESAEEFRTYRSNDSMHSLTGNSLGYVFRQSKDFSDSENNKPAYGNQFSRLYPVHCLHG